MKIILPDYHIHTTLCNHAYGTMEEYVVKAMERGITEMGFAEHMPVMPESHLCISYDDLPYYIERVLALRDKFKNYISIKLGAEMDMNLNRIDEIGKIIEKSDFDYVIGSIHYLDNWPFDQKQYINVFKKTDLTKLYEKFFRTVIEAAKTGLYDITGHIDNLKRMGFHPPSDVKYFYDEAASVLKEMNLTAELNTSGYDYPAGEAYPSPEFLSAMNKYGVPVTVGSDSHKPNHIGRHFEKANEVLIKAGYKEVAIFEKRKRSFIDIV